MRLNMSQKRYPIGPGDSCQVVAKLGVGPFALHVAIFHGHTTREGLMQLFGLGSPHSVRKYLDALIANGLCREDRTVTPYRYRAVLPDAGATESRSLEEPPESDDEQANEQPAEAIRTDEFERPNRARFTCYDGHGASSELERTVDDVLSFYRVRHYSQVMCRDLVRDWPRRRESVDFRLIADDGTETNTLVEVVGRDEHRSADKIRRLRAAGFIVIVIDYENVYRELDKQTMMAVRKAGPPHDEASWQAFQERARYKPPPPKPCQHCNQMECICDVPVLGTPEADAAMEREWRALLERTTEFDEMLAKKTAKERGEGSE
jgi:hypothetical protein